MKHTPGILCKYTIYITINPSYYSYKCRNRNVTAHIRDMPLSHVDYYAHNALPFLATFFFNCSHFNLLHSNEKDRQKRERERESMWPFRWKYLISSFTYIFFRISLSLSPFLFSRVMQNTLCIYAFPYYMQISRCISNSFYLSNFLLI